MKKRAFLCAFKLSVPVLFGYLAIGAAFGFMVNSIGQNFILAFIMSTTIYAGAGQYAAIRFIAENTPLITVAIVTFMINAKHMFYALSMIEKYRNKKHKFYLIFSMTDETYALLSSNEPPNGVDEDLFYFYVSLLNHTYWISGGIIGTLLGSLLKINTKGIEFALCALFVVLVIESYKSAKSKLPFYIGGVCGGLCVVLFGPDNMMIPAALLIVILLSSFKNHIEVEEKPDGGKI